MARLKTLAIAVATGRIGYVYFVGDKLRLWGLSKKASQSTEDASEQAQKWINEMKPDVVVTEKLDTSQKSAKSKSLIAAIAQVAEHNYLLDVSVERAKQFKNKYAEAKAYALQFPDIAPWLPTSRNIWDPEPPNTVYVEGMALALQVIHGKGSLYPKRI